jgi:hypothetical protein
MITIITPLIRPIKLCSLLVSDNVKCVSHVLEKFTSLTHLTVPVHLRRGIKIHTLEVFVASYHSNTTRFGSSLQVVEETAAPLSRCYTSHFKGTNTYKIFEDYF